MALQSHSKHTERGGGAQASLHRSAVTYRRSTDFRFWYDPVLNYTSKLSSSPFQRLGLNQNRVITQCESARGDTLQNSRTPPHTNRTVFVCEALVERMRARHSAAGFRVPPSSCSVSEVLKTSQSTFLSETDTRNKSWARREEFRVLLLEGEE